jgi:hypothetical protein
MELIRQHLPRIWVPIHILFYRRKIKVIISTCENISTCDEMQNFFTNAAGEIQNYNDNRRLLEEKTATSN